RVRDLVEHDLARRKQAVPALERGERDEEPRAELEPGHVVRDHLVGVGCRGLDDPAQVLDPGAPVVAETREVGLDAVGLRHEAGTDGGSVSARRPWAQPKSQASISGGVIPRVVSAVQTWLRWSVPWWTTWARRMPSGAVLVDPSSRWRTTSRSGSFA